jgi:hypothetical protein
MAEPLSGYRLMRPFAEKPPDGIGMLFLKRFKRPQTPRQAKSTRQH